MTRLIPLALIILAAMLAVVSLGVGPEPERPALWVTVTKVRHVVQVCWDGDGGARVCQVVEAR